MRTGKESFTPNTQTFETTFQAIQEVQSLPINESEKNRILELLRNTDIQRRLQTIVTVGKELLTTLSQEYSTDPLWMKLFESNVADFYALLIPLLPDMELPQCVKDAHARHPIIKKYIDQEKIPGKIWTSQKNSNFTVEEWEITESSAGHDPQKEKNREDISRWPGPAGLLLHTFVAARTMQTAVERIQNVLQNKDQESSHPIHKALIQIDPIHAKIWLLLHDIGRLVTHDSFDHAIFSHLICRLIGLPDFFSKDYDLPTLLEFGSEMPAIPLFQKPEPSNGQSKEEYNDLLKKAQTNYINHVVLPKLQEYAQNNPDFGNPIAVLIFWIIDSFTKLYDIRKGKPVASQTDPLKSSTIKEEMVHYSNLQRSDTHILFGGRKVYRQAQQGDLNQTQKQVDEANRIARYYDNQYLLAECIFGWLESIGIDVDNYFAKLFIDATTISDLMLDQNGHFRLCELPEKPNTWLEESQESKDQRRRSVINYLLGKGVPLDSFYQKEIDRLTQ